MIDGEWGCGKTYFVKENLIEKIKRHEEQKTAKTKEYKARQVIYISLYGIKSTDEISRQIMMQSCLEKVDKKEKKEIIQTGSKLMGAALTLLSSLGIDLNVNDFTNKLTDLLPLKNTMLIFDDLERCDCPINEILGYINSFIEQDGLKVILVANQKEIGRSTYQVNQELKYLVAANPTIKFIIA